MLLSLASHSRAANPKQPLEYPFSSQTAQPASKLSKKVSASGLDFYISVLTLGFVPTEIVSQEKPLELVP